MSSAGPLTETVTLSQAKDLIGCLAHEQSVLLLSPPGVGKSDVVRQAATAAGLECKSLLGTQIAPEDVSGVPRIIGERSVFCPPRVLLPENPTRFCLFLDELPACAPDVQKAFYSLLLERRIGEYLLPPGTWVVAAGNRAEDKALVRTISSALVNRVLILNVRIDVAEWVTSARGNGIREDIISFIEMFPAALLRPVPERAEPFSTPRAWASLSRALDLVEQRKILTRTLVGALAAGRVTPADATTFTQVWIEPQPAPPLTREAVLAANLDVLNLSVRAKHPLFFDGIKTVCELVTRSEEYLLEIRYFGELSLKEVKAKLAEHGLSLGMKID